jgi:hypothetical protein
MSTLKAKRMADLRNHGVRTPWPCMRCLSHFKSGETATGDLDGCVFTNSASEDHNAVIWSGMSAEDPNNEIGDPLPHLPLHHLS